MLIEGRTCGCCGGEKGEGRRNVLMGGVWSGSTPEIGKVGAKDL